MEGCKSSAGKGETNVTAIKVLQGRTETLDPEAEALVEQIREQARNLYLSHQMLCAEAVVVALNQGLDGGLSETQAVAMAAPFCVAMGESGCMCGALAGAVMASGLFLSDHRPYRHRQDMRDCARQIHDAFKAANGTTCCRVLTCKVRHDKQAHFQQCAELTAYAAEMAGRLILEKRPELIARTDLKFRSRHHSIIGAMVLKLFHYLSH